MSKVISLTVHRNTAVKRKAGELRGRAKSGLRSCTHHPDMAGYAIVTWNKEGDAHTVCETTKGAVTHTMIPEFVKGILSDAIYNGD